MSEAHHSDKDSLQASFVVHSSSVLNNSTACQRAQWLCQLLRAYRMHIKRKGKIHANRAKKREHM